MSALEIDLPEPVPVRAASRAPRADMDMVGEPDLPAQHREILDHRAAGNADLAGDHAMAADMHIVADHDQIIELAAFADHRVAQRAAVDGGAGADLDTVLDDDAAQLRNLGDSPCRDEAKPKPGWPICAPGRMITRSPI